MKITFLGGAKSVTGANYLLEHENLKILVDCGMLQGGDFVENVNYEDFPYNPAEIDYLFITHGHIDHIGRVPKLVRDGFKGRIIATEPTIDLAKVSLLDSVHIIAQEAAREHKLPFYTESDVYKCAQFFQPCKYGDIIDLAGQGKVQVFSAGHVLGSAMFRFKIGGTTIGFTGDLGNAPAPLIGAADRLGKVDYLVIESAYGDRVHQPARIGSKLLEEIVGETVKRGGVLMIPSFALERTQILLFYLNNLIEQGKIPQIPVFVDSPLAIKITEIYKKYQSYFKEEVQAQILQGDYIFQFPGLQLTETAEQSKAINEVPAPKIIIAGNGMSTAGRILHHESRYLSDPKSTLLIVGYQVQGSLGRRVLDKAKTVKIFGQTIDVKCDVHQISAFSAHADNPQLKAFVLNNLDNKPKKIFIVQGEENAAEQLAFDLDELGYDAYAPNYRESFEL